MDLATWIEWIVKSLMMILVLLTGFAYTTYMERKLLARFQNRYGPNRAGPKGLLQPVADGVKLIFKEELIPAQADKLIFILAPIITTVPAWIMLAVIPLGIKVPNRVVFLAAKRERPECRRIDRHVGCVHLDDWEDRSDVFVHRFHRVLMKIR